MMVIFIEGPDNTGKTTLAKALQDAFGLDYQHCSKPKTDNPYLEYIDMIDNIKQDTVYDRAHLGEYVYSNLWRGGCDISIKQFKDIDLKALTNFENCFLIHAIAPIDIIKERCIKEKEDLLKQDQIKECIELFNIIVGQSELPTIVYDSSTMQPEDIVNELKSRIL